MHFDLKIRPSWAGFQNPSARFMDVCVAVFCPALVCPVGFVRLCLLPQGS